jgi:uncharacterized protein (TIGR01244 family)
MELTMKYVPVALSAFVLAASLAHAQTPMPVEKVDGITNLRRIETTIACSGAITPKAVADIKKMGFVSVVNLRLDSEPGAQNAEEAAAASAAGLKYIHIPFQTANPSEAAVDRFVAVMRESDTQPAFVHCAGGGRAAAMWFVKRAIVDNWDLDRAMNEAVQLGLTSEPLKTYMTGYVKARRK